MAVIVYGDFNCPYSYVASQRVDVLKQVGNTEVDWRAVEHDPGLPLTGTRAEADRERWGAELAEVAALALPGEDVPGAPPAVISNTSAAVAAYAEAVSDGVHDGLRRSLFRAIWAAGRHISATPEVQRLISEIMAPPVPILPHLVSPDLPLPGLSDPDPVRVVRRSGGTIAPDGSPLTTTGYRRIRQWRQEWQSLPEHVIPAVIGPDGAFHPGTDGLGYLPSLVRALADRAATSGPARIAAAGDQQGLCWQPGFASAWVATSSGLEGPGRALSTVAPARRRSLAPVLARIRRLGFS